MSDRKSFVLLSNQFMVVGLSSIKVMVFRFTRWRLFLLCKELESFAREYVAENVDNDTLVDTWNIDDSFHEACIEFIKTSDEFKISDLIENISRLPLNEFLEFLMKTNESSNSSGLPVFNSSSRVKLKLKWLSENQCQENYETLTFGTDFSGISNKDKLIYFRAVIKNMDLTTVEQVTDHIFPEDALKFDTVDDMDQLSDCFNSGFDLIEIQSTNEFKNIKTTFTMVSMNETINELTQQIADMAADQKEEISYKNNLIENLKNELNNAKSPPTKPTGTGGGYQSRGGGYQPRGGYQSRGNCYSGGRQDF